MNEPLEPRVIQLPANNLTRLETVNLSKALLATLIVKDGHLTSCILSLNPLTSYRITEDYGLGKVSKLGPHKNSPYFLASLTEIFIKKRDQTHQEEISNDLHTWWAASDKDDKDEILEHLGT